MVDADRPLSAVESAYLDLRQKVLSLDGERFEISHQQAGEIYGLSRNSVSNVLMTLVLEGYLTVRKMATGHRVYMAAPWSSESIRELATVSAGIVSVALGNSVLSSDPDGLQPSLDAAVSFSESAGEASLFAMIRFFLSLFKGAMTNDFMDMVSDIVPSAFLRLAWLADVGRELPDRALKMVQALSLGDLKKARWANYQFWATVEVQVSAFLEARSRGQIDDQLMALCRSRDMSLSGQVRPFDRPKGNPLLPMLAS